MRFAVKVSTRTVEELLIVQMLFGGHYASTSSLGLRGAAILSTLSQKRSSTGTAVRVIVASIISGRAV